MPWALPHAEPMPLILTNASIKINGTETGVSSPDARRAVARYQHDDARHDVRSPDYPGIVKWSLVATLYQSFDVGATEEVLSAAVAAYKLAAPPRRMRSPGTATGRSADNPSWSGDGDPEGLRADQR